MKSYMQISQKLNVHTNTDIVNLGRVQLGLSKGSLNPYGKECLHQNRGLRTLNNACRISSTGASLSCPFFARPTAVRFAKVITTSSGFFSRMAASPRGRVTELADRVNIGKTGRLEDRRARNISKATSGLGESSLTEVVHMRKGARMARTRSGG